MEMKKHLLFICSGGLDRSPTAEELINTEAGDKFEAKSCGLYPFFADNPLTKQALTWADQVIVMEYVHKSDILERFPLFIKDKPDIIVLDVPNEYVRDQQELKELLRNKLKKEGFLYEKKYKVR
jgi:predicted protein tyrosine phosphatase